MAVLLYRDPADGQYKPLVTGSGGGVSDHGLLNGLGDDDHPQYHNDARADTRYVLKAGDTMSGPLTIDSPTGAGVMSVQSPPGYYSSFAWRKDSVTRRWAWTKDNTTETGGNAGSNLQLTPSADAGQTLPHALNFNRATSLGTVAGNPTAPLGIATKDYADIPWNQEHRFYLGSLEFTRLSSNHVGWVSILGPNQGFPGAFSGSVEITITSSWNYLQADGRHTRRTDLYWDGGTYVSVASDQIITSSGMGPGGVSQGYTIGGPVQDSSRVLWPVYRTTPTIGEGVHVSVSVMGPGVAANREYLRSRFYLYPPEPGPATSPTQGATAWQALSLVNGWVNYDGRTARIRRTLDDMVVVDGVIRNGTAAQFATFPVGFRPPRGNIDMVTSCAGGMVIMSVGTGGDAVLVNPTSGGRYTEYSYLTGTYSV